MELRPLTLDDLWLHEAIHCDPVMMAELGGPIPREGLPAKLRKDVADVEADRVWVLKVLRCTHWRLDLRTPESA